VFAKIRFSVFVWMNSKIGFFLSPGFPVNCTLVLFLVYSEVLFKDLSTNMYKLKFLESREGFAFVCIWAHQLMGARLLNFQPIETLLT